MDEIANMPGVERADVFQETAARMGIGSAVAMEKDYWVCWMLRRLFEPSIAPAMVFKGGTSLSKVYRAIERFSEDIDLSIPRTVLGFDATDDPADGRSKTQTGLLLDRMRTACDSYVRGHMLTELHSRIEQTLGIPTPACAWSIAPAEGEAELRFAYPRALAPQAYGVATYIGPSVLLEFGGRAEVWPAEDRTLQPYCTEQISGLTDNPTCQVHVLAAERTFWEKATLLHMEFYRFTPDKPTRRISRHYSDLAQLWQTPIGERALDKFDLLRAVAEHKASYFPATGAHYAEAAEGIVHLVPSDAAVPALTQDYSRMREMFFNDPVGFDAILQQLHDIELAIANRRLQL
jgi:hypothetical protein